VMLYGPIAQVVRALH